MITMKVEGKILDALRKADSTLKKATADAVKKASTIVWGQTVKNAPVGASGALRKGIRRELFPTKATITPSVKYARDVEEGRTPAQVDFQELWASARAGGSLHRWAKKRGMNPYALAKSIKKKGTKAQPFMQNTIDQTKTDVQRELGAVLEATVRKLSGN